MSYLSLSVFCGMRHSLSTVLSSTATFPWLLRLCSFKPELLELLPGFPSLSPSFLEEVIPWEPPSSYFMWPLDNVNCQSPFASLTSLLSSRPKLQSLPTSPQETQISVIALSLHPSHTSALRSPSSRGYRDSKPAFFIAPIKLVTEPLESVYPFHSHAPCLIQGLCHTTWAPTLSSLSVSQTPSFLTSLQSIATSLTVQSKMQTTGNSLMAFSSLWFHLLRPALLNQPAPATNLDPSTCNQSQFSLKASSRHGFPHFLCVMKTQLILQISAQIFQSLVAPPTVYNTVYCGLFDILPYQLSQRF